MLTVSLILAGALAAQAPAKTPDRRRLRRPLEREDHRRRGHLRERRVRDREEGRRPLGRRRLALGQLPAGEVGQGRGRDARRGPRGEPREDRHLRGPPRGRRPEGQGHLPGRQGPPLRGQEGPLLLSKKAPVVGRAGHALRRQDPRRLEAARHEEEERLGGGERRAGRGRAEGQRRPRQRAGVPGHEAAHRVQRGRRSPTAASTCAGGTRSRSSTTPTRRWPSTPTAAAASTAASPRSLDATKPAGEWQAYDIEIVGRQVSVTLNGKKIVQGVLDGITGGALNPFEGEPGPLMLQGDHGKVRFRNIVVTPACSEAPVEPPSRRRAP